MTAFRSTLSSLEASETLSSTVICAACALAISSSETSVAETEAEALPAARTSEVATNAGIAGVCGNGSATAKDFGAASLLFGVPLALRLRQGFTGEAEDFEALPAEAPGATNGTARAAAETLAVTAAMLPGLGFSAAFAATRRFRSTLLSPVVSSRRSLQSSRSCVSEASWIFPLNKLTSSCQTSSY